MGVTGEVTDDNTLSGTSTDTFWETELSLDDLIVNYLQESSNPYLLAIGNIWQNDVDAKVAGISWDLLDLDLVGDISTKQSVELT